MLETIKVSEHAVTFTMVYTKPLLHRAVVIDREHSRAHEVAYTSPSIYKKRKNLFLLEFLTRLWQGRERIGWWVRGVFATSNA